MLSVCIALGAEILLPKSTTQKAIKDKTASKPVGMIIYDSGSNSTGIVIYRGHKNSFCCVKTVNPV